MPQSIGTLSPNGAPRNAVLLLDRASALAVDDFLRYSGLNFFILYGLAAAAFRKLPGNLPKSAAFAVLLLVCALLLFSASWHSALYPLTLAALGVVLGVGTRGG